jgi:hypothetical protein
MRTLRPSLPLVLLLLAGLVIGSAEAQQQVRRQQTQREAPAHERSAAKPGGSEPSPEHVLKDFVKQHMPTHLIEKAKRVASELPPAEKERLKALASQAWRKYRPLLGNDSRALQAQLNRALSLVPSGKLARLEQHLDKWLDKGGIGAAALAAELLSYDQDELLGKLYGFLELHGDQLHEAAGSARAESRALRGVAAALSVQRLLAGSAAASTRQSLRQLGLDTQLTIAGKQQSLQSWAENLLAKQFPYLEGTPATANPEAILSAALVAPDLADLMQTMPLVVTPFDDPVPPAQYLALADPSDTEGILMSLSAIARTVILRQSLTSGSSLRPATNSFMELLSGEEELNAGSLDVR